jgi:hypothetical protein
MKIELRTSLYATSTHFPPPVGPTCGQWTYNWVRIEAVRTYDGTHLGPNLCQNYMYHATDDIISPRLVRPPKRFCGKRLSTIRDTVVHRIVTNAGLRLQLANSLDGVIHRGGGVYIESVGHV